MTTLKPQLIRADTLDLQTQDSPSAKDHTRQPTHPSPVGFGPAAPHQNQALRNAEQDALQQQMTSPRVLHDQDPTDFTDEPDFYDDQDDEGHDGLPIQNDQNHGQSADDSGIDDSDIGDQADDDGMDDDMMDKISSSPSIDEEDIDFEFVYALHTFVATVEGQANATKGDTMVLLDDSNSYWWLVRVVKDGSIGYLPAEHIETPTERLARLNKHRNIDLSATMLGDNPEKSKNPLKKAMRRRNAKTVQFAPPQYFEPSDFEYSDDEEDDEGDLEGVENGQDISQTEDTEMDGTAAAGTKIEQNGQGVNGVQIINNNDNAYGERLNGPEKSRDSDEVNPEDRLDDPNARSKRGLARNTDSFFKDDGIETKKISLTPRLLRGDSDLNLPVQQPDLKAKSSLETFDKLVSPESDKSGDEKKKKEKKGMLGGFFKRKDKKGKMQDNEIEDGKKASDELSRVTPQPKKSSESLGQDVRPVKADKIPHRQTSKLQKQPPPHVSPKTSPSKDNFQRIEPSPHPSMDSTLSPSSQDSSSTPSTVRSPVAEAPKAPENISPRIGSPEVRPERATSPNENRSMYSTITDALKPAPVASANKAPEVGSQPILAQQTHDRFDDDDMGSDEDITPVIEPQQIRHLPPTVIAPPSERHRERLSESPIEVSPIEPPERHKSSSAAHPPALMVDTSSNSERRSVSPISPTSSSSPSLVDADAETPNDAEESTNPTATSPHADAPTPSTARSTPTWSDASLRTYMDNDDDIRDLLIIVHDKSNVIPAGPDHPITGHLFGAEKGRLAEMQSNLDSMLTNWLVRKNQTRLSR